jgi:hypothetical protein
VAQVVLVGRVVTRAVVVGARVLVKCRSGMAFGEFAPVTDIGRIWLIVLDVDIHYASAVPRIWVTAVYENPRFQPGGVTQIGKAESHENVRQA